MTNLKVAWPASIRVATLFMLLLAALATTPIDRAHAVSASSWQAGNIIDDSIFTNKGAMSVSQIQSWLDIRLQNCDPNGSRVSELSGGTDYNGDGKVTRAEYGKTYGNPAPFTCLNKYYEVPKTTPGPSIPASNYGKSTIPTGARSAARLIYDAAQAYNISPKVLLVKLGTESAGPLTSDTWPFKSQFTYAMGAHCPDSGPGGSANCDTDYSGFSLQMHEAAKLLRWYLDSMTQSWWSYKKPYATNYILWNVAETGCGGSNVFIKNKATAALYTYTPYQPNSSSLNSYPGTGNSCSSYGNRNFWYVYNNWFGSTHGSTVYDYSLLSYTAYSDSAYTSQLSRASVKPNDSIYIKVSIKNTGNQVWYNQSATRLGTQQPKDRDSVFADQSWITPHRTASMEDTVVPPGSSTSFKFKITAPEVMGYYPEYFGLVIENERWFKESFGIPIYVETTEPYYAVSPTEVKLYKDATHTLSIDPSAAKSFTGKRLYGVVKIKNIGNQSLPADITKIGTNNPRDRASVFEDTDWLSNKRVTSLTGSDLAPGDTGEFTFSLLGPSELGEYDERFGLVIEGQRWVDEDLFSYGIKAKAPPITSLDKGSSLKRGESIYSGDEDYRLTMQYDGNLVLYNARNKPVWSSRTNGRSGTVVKMQYDGNLVLYTSNNRPLWATGTNKKSAAVLRMQYDGNVVIYNSSDKPVWATGTNK